MEKQTYMEKLARYIIFIGVIAIVGVVCWYFSSVIIYILLACVLSLLSQPLKHLMQKVKIKGKSGPNWLLSILSIIIVLSLLLLIVIQIIPVITDIVNDASLFSSYEKYDGNFRDDINRTIISIFPSLDEDFDCMNMLMTNMRELMSNFSVTSLLGSVGSVIVGVVVGLFSMVFISFFFVQDENLFSKIVAALVPDRHEASVTDAIMDIEHLLSRYFVGLLLEMLAVALMDFLGLWVIGRVHAIYALGIAFIAGVLNILPYVGPIIGYVLGSLLCMLLKYGTGMGLDVNIWVFGLIIVCIMLAVQLVDNFVLQPIIYSTSIQATALEIFIVMLIAGTIGGILGMLVAIPSYTVVRVIAGRFFYDRKAVQRLMPDINKKV
jgi:predicted PurR-regulated permease PerM